MRNSIVNKSLILTLAVAAVLAGGLILLLQGTVNHSARAAGASEAPKLLQGAFGIYRDDALQPTPEALDAISKDPSFASIPFQLDPGLIRIAASDASHRVIVVAGGTYVCVFNDEYQRGAGGGGCALQKTATTDAQPMIGYSHAGPGGFRVTGLVPDGIDAVRLTSAKGSTTSVPVENNVFTTVVPAGKINVAWGEGDAHSVDLEPSGPDE